MFSIPKLPTLAEKIRHLYIMDPNNLRETMSFSFYLQTQHSDSYRFRMAAILQPKNCVKLSSGVYRPPVLAVRLMPCGAVVRLRVDANYFEGRDRVPFLWAKSLLEAPE